MSWLRPRQQRLSWTGLAAWAEDPWAPRWWLVERPFSLRLPELWGNMDRHRPRLHHSTQGSAAGAPYPSSASLRSFRESKMLRSKGPQHPPPPGGAEGPGEKRPKFVSVAWGWGVGQLLPGWRAAAQVPGFLRCIEGGGSMGPAALNFVIGFQSCQSLSRFTTTRPSSFWILRRIHWSSCCPKFLKAVQMCMCIDVS